MNQIILDYIKKEADLQIWYLEKDVDNFQSKNEINLIRKFEKILRNEIPADDEFVLALKGNNYKYLFHYFSNVIFEIKNHFDENEQTIWDVNHSIFQKLVTPKNSRDQDLLGNLVNRLIALKFVAIKNLKTDEFIEFLYARNFTDTEIINIVFHNSYYTLYLNRNYFGIGYQKVEYENLTKFGEFIRRKIENEKKSSEFEKTPSTVSLIDSIVINQKSSSSDKIFEWLFFLSSYHPECITDYRKYLYQKGTDDKIDVCFGSIFFLIKNEVPNLHEILVTAILDEQNDLGNKFSALYLINEKQNGRYHQQIIDIGEPYYAHNFKKGESSRVYHYDCQTEFGPLSVAYAKYLLNYDAVKGKERIERFLQESDFIYPHFLPFLDSHFGSDSTPYLFNALYKESDKPEYYPTIFEILDHHDLSEYVPLLIDFMIHKANSKTRKLASIVIAKYTDLVLQSAIDLINQSTVNQRITGSLILSEINSDISNAKLNEAVDLEINDDTRDIMLETLAEKRFALPYPLEMVDEMILKAKKRKKLAKWNEKWIDEDKLPKLFWKDAKKELSSDEIRFLIYRMKRAKGLNSDIEAKQVLNHVDKETSGKFAKAILQAFQDSNSDIKLKHYLTIAGLLGKDDMMHSLNILFKNNMSISRFKMAEYIIGALAMIGTNKALRNVDAIYRKYTNKKPVISLAAKEALTAAAKELNITMDELSDRIIPNFDFEGLFRNFEIDGEEYRAFVSSNFSLNFLNEENKIRKSVPANTPKELKAEFKEIEKEIKEIVKSQNSRLEKYMLEERRWSATDWYNMVFMNPIMFIYTLKLIWGIFDKHKMLIDLFYCSEDSSLLNFMDEEITLEDDQFIGIVHPIHLSKEQKEVWHDKVFEMGMQTCIPVFERNVYILDDNEKEENHSKMFYGMNVPQGADFVNSFLVKKNWLKTTGDGGRSEFSKWYKEELMAYANIDGPVAIYLGGEMPATVYEISFYRNDRKKELKLEDVPLLFFSEVMSDIDQLIKA